MKYYYEDTMRESQKYSCTNGKRQSHECTIKNFSLNFKFACFCQKYSCTNGKRQSHECTIKNFSLNFKFACFFSVSGFEKCFFKDVIFASKKERCGPIRY